MWCRVLHCVQRNFLLRLRLRMTDDTGPLQYAPHSWILDRVPRNCISQCTVDSFVSRSQSCGSRRVAFKQAFNSPPTCFAVSLLSPLTSSQVPAPSTTFTDTPLFEVHSANIGPCYFVLHRHLSRGARHISSGLPLHSDLHIECIVTAIRRPGTARIPSVLSASHLSDSGILLTFASRVLIASPCSVTTTASGDDNTMSTNTPGWNRGSHFPPLGWLGWHVQNLLSEFQDRCCPFAHAASAAVSFRRC